jgi:3-phosphoshikimate 1-carboxyvinyltransferase
MFNRALIAQSFLPEIKIVGQSKADDVSKMKQALADFALGKTELDVGQAGTVLRFLALRVSRKKGKFILKGSEKLMQRPHEELERILAQLGCQVVRSQTAFEIKSHGWHLHGDGIFIKGDQSSQFASALVLSSWLFDHHLFINLQGSQVSRGYLEMTLQMMKGLGMVVGSTESELHISPLQCPRAVSIALEPDMSSSFAIAAFAAVGGQAHFPNFPEKSLQPDAIFPELLERMGVNVEKSATGLKVGATKKLTGSEFFIENCPDTFPVLSALCFLAEGESKIRGGSHLRFKESDRLSEMANLFERLGRKPVVYEDGLDFSGVSPKAESVSEFEFDTKDDHRLAMAAALLNSQGFRIKIKDKSVVNKSFPEFWDIVGDNI